FLLVPKLQLGNAPLAPSSAWREPACPQQEPASEQSRSFALNMGSQAGASEPEKNCHSERSEESRLLKYLRPFAPFRVTEKAVLK
ncbi:MAG: hypothetical protein WBV16_10425, partial [Desulfobaccales bacterium]